MAQAKLMRSETDKVISGVCGGISVYLGVDSVFVRLAFLLLLFASGIGFLLYIVLMIIMPSESNFDDPSSKIVQDNIEQFGNDFASSVKNMRQHPQGPTIAAGLLIILGIYLLFENLGWLAWIGSGVFWPILLIGAGVYLIVRRRK